MPYRFKLYCSYNYIAVKLQLHIVKNMKNIKQSLGWNQEQKPLKVAEKCGVPRNIISA